MDTPADSTSSVGWKIETGVSRLRSSSSAPMENSSTIKVTTELTTSIRADSRSATRAMPRGCGQAPTQSTIGPTPVGRGQQRRGHRDHGDHHDGRDDALGARAAG